MVVRRRVGILVVAPILLVLYDVSKRAADAAQLLEGRRSSPGLMCLSAFVFLAGAWRYPYLIFPFLLWAACASSRSALPCRRSSSARSAPGAAVDDSLPLGGETATERVQLAQAGFAVVVVGLLVVGATLAEREAATRAWR